MGRFGWLFGLVEWVNGFRHGGGRFVLFFLKGGRE